MNRRAPYRYAFAAIVLALAAACSQKGGAAVDGSDAALKSAMAADVAFSDLAQTAGMAEAFGKYMDPVDGKMISPGEITTGEAAIRAAFKDWPADLKMAWAPDMGHAAKSGDLAVTSGRFTRTRDGAVVSTGRYVTTWRKDAGGDWKGVMDIGVADPPPAPPPREPDPEGRPG